MQFPQHMLNDANKKTVTELKKAIHSMQCSESSKTGNGKKRLDTYVHVLNERLNVDPCTEGQEENDNNLPLDLLVARKYQQLYTSAMKRSKEWNLSLSDVKKLITRKTCQYSGVKLTKGSGDVARFSDLTIDRLDNTRGYVKGNVYSVCHGANQIKNYLFEANGGCGLSLPEVQKFINAMSKLNGGK